MRRKCLSSPSERLSFRQLVFLPAPPLLRSTLNELGQSGHLVVYCVCNLLPGCRLTWHIINSYKHESTICSLCQWIGSEVAQPLLAFSPRLAWIIHSVAERGITLRCDPGQQITFCFRCVVKVNVSQVQTRVMYSRLSHFADWMSKQIVSSWNREKR